MNKKDKQVLAITILSLILAISILINLVCFVIINDLNSTIDRHLNSRNVCRTELKTLQNEFDEYRKDYFKDK